MISIVYASRASTNLNAVAVAELLVDARARNQAEGVTGMLLYAYASFVQVIEGEADPVDRVFASITRDPRHGDLRLLGRRPIRQRRYADWTMGFEHPGAGSAGARLPGYNATLRYPLVSSDLISNAEVAEHLLALLASQQMGQPAPR